jgi:hypothetical protein
MTWLYPFMNLGLHTGSKGEANRLLCQSGFAHYGPPITLFPSEVLFCILMLLCSF